MPQKLKFQEGEQLLCFHGPLLYEAKCVKVEVKEKVVKYLIHYSGWNKSWDEWVTESRILKLNEAGLQKQKDLQQEHSTKNRAARLKEKEFLKEKEKDPFEARLKGGSKPTTPQPPANALTSTTPLPLLKSEKKSKQLEERVSSPSVAVTPIQPEKPVASNTSRKKRQKGSETSLNESTNESLSEPPRKKRQRVDSNVDSEDSYKTRTEVNIVIESDLKPWLVDDWDLITRQRQIVKLPCRITVVDILKDFEENSRLESPENDEVKDLCSGLQEYFDAMLGAQLLYKVERPQYSEILKKFPDKRMSEVYGASHLLRLFVKIGGVLSYSSLDQKTVDLVVSYIHKLLKYLSETKNKYLSLQDYVVAPPEHHRKAL